MAKYKEVKVIQQNYAGKWEDASEYEKDQKADLRLDVKEYQAMGYPTRIITRRVLND